MENPEIPGRIQIERFIPVEIFRKKKNTFRGITFFPFLPETNKIFCTICLGYQCQASSRKKAKNLLLFCKWYNSIPFLFSVPKRVPVPFDGNFSPKFPYKWLALKVPPELFEQFGCLETACIRLFLASLGIFFSLRYC